MSRDEVDSSPETPVDCDDVNLDYNLSDINRALGDWQPSQQESEDQYQINSSKEGYLASDPQPNRGYDFNLKDAYRAIFYDLGYDSLSDNLAEDGEVSFKDYFPDIKIEKVSKYQLPSGVLGLADPSSRRVFIREDLYDWAEEKVEEHEISHILHDWDELRNRLETDTLNPSRFVPGPIR